MIKGIKILLLIPAFLFFSEGYAQKREIKKGNSQFELLQYYAASELYKKAIVKIEEDNDLKNYALFKLAECYRLMNLPDTALPIYDSLMLRKYCDLNSQLYLRYAMVLQTTGNIHEAKKNYSKYKKINGKSQYAKTGIKSCDWILSNADKRARAKIAELSAVNSTYDDFAPAFTGDDFEEIVFTSNRPGTEGKHIDQWYGLDFSDLFYSKQHANNWNSPAVFDDSDIINTQAHEGTPSFNGDFSAMYFTRCKRMSERSKFCRILRIEKDSSGWTEPVVVFADTTGNVGQPCISKDELTIVFASDRDGGSGGKDIWISKRKSKDETFVSPLNLGPRINTFGNEMFPYLFNDTTLYFSSDGYPGYGGLDIYMSVFRNRKWQKPKNLLKPINSGYDDFGIIIKTPDTQGYLSSNRPGGTGRDDIFIFTERSYKFTLTGIVRDLMSLLPVEGVSVQLKGQNGDLYMMTTDLNGQYSFDSTQLHEDIAYELTFKKQGFFTAKDSLSTKAYEGDHDFTRDIIIEPIPEKPILLPDILFPLDEWTLEPQYQDSLRHLVQILNDNETIVIELRSHTDSRASIAYNDNLSQKRAQAVVDFLISQAINPNRLVAKGYGERIPRTLNKDIFKEGYLFRDGTLLDDDYVNSLPEDSIKEAAFHLNRRTEFAVLANDFKVDDQLPESAPEIQIVADTLGVKIYYSLDEEENMQVNCYLNNDHSTTAILNFISDESLISDKIVLEMLHKGAVTRNDFLGNFEDVMIDGNIAEHSILTLKSIKIGELQLNEAMVKVVKDYNKNISIGKATIKKAGKYAIDMDNKTIVFTIRK